MGQFGKLVREVGREADRDQAALWRAWERLAMNDSEGDEVETPTAWEVMAQGVAYMVA